MKILNFRPGTGGGRRIGLFDVEVTAGVCLQNLTLIRKPSGVYRVFGKNVLIKFAVADEIAQAVLQIGGHDND